MTRSRLSTTASQVALSQTIQTALIEPSQELDEDELAAFNKIIRSRETASWSQHDIDTATSLARQMVIHADLIQTVKTEGTTIEHPKKGLIVHPAIAASVSLAGAIKGLSTLLGLSASQRGVAGNRQAIRNQHEQILRDALANTAGGLLA